MQALQSPDPGKGPRDYSLASQKRTFQLSQKRTSELGCCTRCLPTYTRHVLSKVEMSC